MPRDFHGVFCRDDDIVEGLELSCAEAKTRVGFNRAPEEREPSIRRARGADDGVEAQDIGAEERDHDASRLIFHGLDELFSDVELGAASALNLDIRRIGEEEIDALIGGTIHDLPIEDGRRALLDLKIAAMDHRAEWAADDEVMGVGRAMVHSVRLDLEGADAERAAMLIEQNLRALLTPLVEALDQLLFRI